MSLTVHHAPDKWTLSLPKCTAADTITSKQQQQQQQKNNFSQRGSPNPKALMFLNVAYSEQYNFE